MSQYRIRVINKKPYLCHTSGSYCVEITSYDKSTDTFTRRNDCRILGKIVPRETLKLILDGYV